jgi:hypothetical protein
MRGRLADEVGLPGGGDGLDFQEFRDLMSPAGGVSLRERLGPGTTAT